MATAADSKPPIPWRRLLADYLGMLVVLALMMAFFSLRTEHFFSRITFLTIANQLPEAALIAVGMTFVILIGGIDLSVGSVLGLSGGVLGIALLQWKMPLPAAIALCLLVGLACGLVNGLIVVRFALPSFIVTLGMLEAARGGTYLLTNSQTQYIGSAVEKIAETSFSGLSLPFLLTLLTVALAQLLLWRTRFGRHVFAVGSNEEAARLSGIDTRRVKLIVFVVCGFLSAVAALIATSRLSSADPNAGSGAELQAIAAVVIGGTSLMGGRGSVLGSFLGTLLIAVLSNGLTQMNAPDPMKRLITGAVIVLAVILDAFRTRLARRS